jgi:hypothetical protein
MIDVNRPQVVPWGWFDIVVGQSKSLQTGSQYMIGEVRRNSDVPTRINDRCGKVETSRTNSKLLGKN